MAGYYDDESHDATFIQRIKEIVLGKEAHLRIVILGYPSVGKTALMIRCLTDEFYNHYVPHKEETYQYTLYVGKKKIHLDIMESKGKNNALISHADGVILVYSVTDPQSYDHVKEMIGKVRELNLNKIPIIIVANKIDKSQQRKVKKDENKKLAEEYNVVTFELSAAIPSTNMDSVFYEIYEQICNKHKYRSRTDSDPGSTLKIQKKVHLVDLQRRLSTSLDSTGFAQVILAESLN